MVQRSSNNIQGGQLEVAPELAPHWGPKDRMAEDASLAEDAETCAWLSWAGGSATSHLSVSTGAQKPVDSGVLSFSRRDTPASNSP